MWSLHTTNAAQEVEIKITKVQVEKIEEVFECFRKENREDHKEILMELRKKP
jgi:ferritin-like metal-binding protein YciE